VGHKIKQWKTVLHYLTQLWKHGHSHARSFTYNHKTI
jgi:hypothetical protein